ncbi:MAG: cytochrome c oxidase assembly protein [Methylobacter sp.]
MPEHNRVKTSLTISLVLAAPPTFAHAPGEVVGNSWHLEPEVTIPLLLTAFAYVSGIRHLQCQGIRRRVVSTGRCAVFALGMLALVVALMSPLDSLAEWLFSAHMTQHLMLMLAAPPLLVLGRMDLVLLWTFPLPLRRWIGQRWNKALRLRVAIGLLGQPVSVWLLASTAMWFWHIPGPYAWAFSHRYIHILEHLSFFLTSLAFWALVLRPFSRNKSGHGAALMLLITFALESSLLGALLVFAGHPLYVVHTVHLPYFPDDMSPLQDQQLAGLIMWVPAGFVQLAALAAVFADLLSVSQSRQAGSIES